MPPALAPSALIVADTPPVVVRSGVLKKPGMLTSSKIWVFLTNEALTWTEKEPPKDAPLATLEIADSKHRICLTDLSIWESTDHDSDFEVELEGRDTKPHKFRAKDSSAAAEWADAIREAKAAAEARLYEDSSTWLAHLNACTAVGCTHQKYCCGFCRPHFRLFYGEDPETEAARLRAEEQQPRFKAMLHALVVPRLTGTLVVGGKKDGLGVELSESDGLVTSSRKDSAAETAGIKENDVLIGVNGYRVHGHTQLLALLPQLPPSATVTLAVVRVTDNRRDAWFGGDLAWQGMGGESAPKDDVQRVLANRDLIIARSPMLQGGGVGGWGGGGGGRSAPANTSAAGAPPAGGSAADSFSKLFSEVAPVVSASLHGRHAGRQASSASLVRRIDDAHSLVVEAARIFGGDDSQKVLDGVAKASASLAGAPLSAVDATSAGPVGASASTGRRPSAASRTEMLKMIQEAAETATADGGDAPAADSTTSTPLARPLAASPLELSTLLVKLPEWGVSEDASIAGLLKALSHEMLFPALDDVKQACHPSLTVHALPSTWEVHVRVLSSEWHVAHQIWADAAAVVLPGAPKVRFQLRLLLRFDPRFQSCRGASVSLLDHTTNESDGTDTHDQLLAFLAPLMQPPAKSNARPIVEYRRVWQRPLATLRLWNDLPRLLQASSVHVRSLDAHGRATTLFGPADAPTKPIAGESAAPAAAAAASKLLATLATHLDGTTSAQALEEPLRTHLGPGSAGRATIADTCLALQALFAECDEPTGWTSLLRCCCSEMLAPACVALHRALSPHLAYRDVRGDLKLDMTIHPEKVVVRQMKSEMAPSNEPSELFRFEWALSLTLDREASELLAVDVAVTSVTYGPHTSYSTICQVGGALSAHMDASGAFPYQHVWHSLLLYFDAATVKPRPKIEDATIEDEPADVAAPTKPPAVADELKWLKALWSARALRHTLVQLGGVVPAHLAAPETVPSATGDATSAVEPAKRRRRETAALAQEAQGRGALADLVWAAIKARGVTYADARRLELPANALSDNGDDPKTRQVLFWIECVLGGTSLQGVPVEEALRSGERLCDLVNAIKPGVVTRVTRQAACMSMSATRLAAKQRENITRYLEACTFLGVRSSDLFVTADLVEANRPDAVVRNILALGQLATSIAEYHGPTLPVGRGRQWERQASLVRDDASTAQGIVRASTAVSISGRAASQSSAGPSFAMAELDVTGLDESAAARAWVQAVLRLPEGDGATPTDLRELLGSGVLLCRLMNAVSPGIITKVKETDRPWDHMANIAHYTKACQRLHVAPTFETPDLFEGKNLKIVAQNVLALGRIARTKRQFAGPHLAGQKFTMQL